MDSLQIASFTITEKGYGVSGAEEDFKNGPDRAKTYMGQVAGLLYRRFLAGKKPIAMVSMDNCSHNGDRLLEAMETFCLLYTSPLPKSLICHLFPDLYISISLDLVKNCSSNAFAIISLTACSGSQCSRTCSIFKSNSLSILMPPHKSVSYTHLDVYKRQAFTASPFIYYGILGSV